jgi:hypothetical protein
MVAMVFLCVEYLKLLVHIILSHVQLSLFI